MPDLYSDVWEYHDNFVFEGFFPYARIIPEHIAFHTIVVVSIESFDCLWDSICFSYIHLDRCDERIFSVSDDESDLCSGFFTVKCKIMRFSEFSLEFEKYKVLYRSLFHLSLVVDISEDSPEIEEMREVELHVSCRLCSAIITPWTYSSYDLMTHEDFRIFMDLSSGYPE